ncbi:GNAT family N-acetyltransferase [Pseudaeromonas sp. ZJS20]|uniref:GNAT family N-acetyltransferase n=1 Tax=Pseudaeromonas aegiceratis TaxID=3153928 RepID=UPI00390C5FB0
MPFEIRAIDEADWPQIMQLQRQAYHAVTPEREAVLRSKQRLGPRTCWVAIRRQQVVGYCLAHPWHAGPPPCLDQEYLPVSEPALLYVHDVVVAPQAQGLGVAAAFLRCASAQARAHQLPSMALVAVQGAAGFWRRHRFAPGAHVPDPTIYGPAALYLQRPCQAEAVAPVG